MKCEQQWTEALLAFEYDALESDERAALATHLEACPSCRTAASRLKEAALTLKATGPGPLVIWERASDAAAKKGITAAPVLASGLAVEVKLDCTYCKSEVGEGESVHCARCLARYHEECFRENGACGVMGCEGASLLRPVSVDRPKRGKRGRRVAGGLALLVGVGTAIGVAGLKTGLDTMKTSRSTRADVEELQGSVRALQAIQVAPAGSGLSRGPGLIKAFDKASSAKEPPSPAKLARALESAVGGAPRPAETKAQRAQDPDSARAPGAIAPSPWDLDDDTDAYARRCGELAARLAEQPGIREAAPSEHMLAPGWIHLGEGLEVHMLAAYKRAGPDRDDAGHSERQYRLITAIEDDVVVLETNAGMSAWARLWPQVAETAFVLRVDRKSGAVKSAAWRSGDQLVPVSHEADRVPQPAELVGIFSGEMRFNGVRYTLRKDGIPTRIVAAGRELDGATRIQKREYRLDPAPPIACTLVEFVDSGDVLFLTREPTIAALRPFGPTGWGLVAYRVGGRSVEITQRQR